MSNTKTAKRRRRWKQLLGAGCLALGMATAWGGQAQAATVATEYLNVSVNTSQTIHDAFICYVISSSTSYIQSLGELAQGESTLSLLMDYTDHHSSYGIIGLYGNEGAEGVAYAFPLGTPITSATTWESIFQAGGSYNMEEGDVVQLIHDVVANVPDKQKQLAKFACHYSAHPFSPYPIEFGQTAQLIGFSSATPLGTITAALSDTPLPEPTAVPEPATWVLLVGLAGVALVGRRKLLGG